MKYHTLFFRKQKKMSQNVSSAAVVIGALRVTCKITFFHECMHIHICRLQSLIGRHFGGHLLTTHILRFLGEEMLA